MKSELHSENNTTKNHLKNNANNILRNNAAKILLSNDKSTDAESQALNPEK